MGDTVVLGYFDDEQAAQELAAGLAGACVRIDVRDDTSIKDAFSYIFNRFGRLDVLVNNAGVFRGAGILSSQEDFDACMHTNAYGILSCAREYAFRSSQGVIISVTSIRGHRSGVRPGALVYAASKAAAESITRSLAQELHGRFTVNAVAPGPVDTAMQQQKSADERAEHIRGMHPQKFFPPERLAQAVVFLAQSPHITGQSIVIDSGSTLP